MKIWESRNLAVSFTADLVYTDIHSHFFWDSQFVGESVLLGSDLITRKKTLRKAWNFFILFYFLVLRMLLG